MPATITVKPWHDPVVDVLGHDPRSRYVETFWLPTLGPPKVSVQPTETRSSGLMNPPAPAPSKAAPIRAVIDAKDVRGSSGNATSCPAFGVAICFDGRLLGSDVETRSQAFRPARS
jgi:hypothetical protein